MHNLIVTIHISNYTNLEIQKGTLLTKRPFLNAHGSATRGSHENKRSRPAGQSSTDDLTAVA